MRRIKLSLLKDWKIHAAEWSKCDRCSLGEMAQNHVLGRGSLPCDVLMIGEAPGNVEDQKGSPFIGPAGDVLQDMIRMARKQVKFRYFITNTVACKPQDRAGGPFRQPTRDEQEKCYPRLWDLMDFCGCKGVIRLGRIAKDRVSVRGGLGFLDVYHPSYILRNGGKRSPIFHQCVDAMIMFCQHLRSQKT